MKTVSLQQLATLDFGFAFDSKKMNTEGVGTPIIKIGDVSEGEASSYFSGDFNEKYIVTKGDLLLGLSGSFTLGEWKGQPALLNQRICRIRAINELCEQDFLRFFLPLALQKLIFDTPSATIKNLAVNDIRDLQVPLLSKAQQSSIIKKLLQAESLICQISDLRKAQSELTNSVVFQYFGARNWPKKPLGEVTKCLDSKRRPVSAIKRPDGAVPYFGANGQQGWINNALFDEPLVLVAEDGGFFNTPERGVAYKISGPSWVNNHAHVLKPLDEITIDYLYYSLRNFDFTPHISGSTRSKLNQKQLNAVQISLPPMDLQLEFGEVIQKLEMLGLLEQKTQVLANELRDSLLSEAFG